MKKPPLFLSTVALTAWLILAFCWALPPAHGAALLKSPLPEELFLFEGNAALTKQNLIQAASEELKVFVQDKNNRAIIDDAAFQMELAYRAAGYPTILNSISESQLKRIVFIWVSLSSLFALSYPFFRIDMMPLLSYVFIILVVLFIISFYYLIIHKSDLSRAFILSNSFITSLFIIYAIGSLPYEI